MRQEIKIPLHVVSALAECLQVEHDKNYGPLLSLAQIEKAEKIMREWFATQVK